MHFADGGIVRLVNTCGVGIAMELELMDEAITAERAKECHLVNRVVPREQLVPTVEDIAAKILRNPNCRRVSQGDDPRGRRPALGRPTAPGMPLRLLDHGRPPRSWNAETRSSPTATPWARTDRCRRTPSDSGST
jgi:enoyl-CoA hydratase/carnithine racemase